MLAFSLNAVRALDENSGFVAGSLGAAAHRVVWSQKGDGTDCKLTLLAVDPGIQVVQDRAFGDCGFGNGVVADGLYRKTAADGKLGTAPRP